MIKELLKQIGELDTGPTIIIDDLAFAEELLEKVRFEFNNKQVGVPEPDDLPDEDEGLEPAAMDARKAKYSIEQLKQRIRDYNKTAAKADRLKIGGTEDELIERLLEAKVEL